MGNYSSYGTLGALTGSEYLLASGGVEGAPDEVLRVTTRQVALTGRRQCIIIAASDTVNPGAADYVCTGSGDDVVISEAINSLRGIGGTVLLRAGTYGLTSPIVHDADWVSLIGEARGFWGKYNGPYPTLSSEGMPGGAKLKQLTANTDGIHVGTNYESGSPRHQGLRFKDLYLYGPGGGIGIYDPANTDISEITDCVFHNWGSGIDIAWDTPFISGNSVQSCTGTGLAHRFVFGTIVKNIFYDLGGSGLLLTGAGGTQVLGNTIGSVGYTSQTSAILIEGGKAHAISGNTVQGINTGCPSVIEIVGGALHAVTGNTLSVDDIVGNAVTANLTANGVYLHSGSTGCVVTGNTINNTNASASGKAVVLGAAGDSTASTGNAVAGNTITGGKWNGGGTTTIIDNSGGATNQIGINAGDARTGSGISDAPADGTLYGRKNNAWSPVTGGSVPAGAPLLGGSSGGTLVPVSIGSGLALSGVSGSQTLSATGSGGTGTNNTVVTVAPWTRPSLSAFTQRNTSGATITDHANGPLTILLPSGAANACYGVEQAIPTGETYTVTAQIRFMSPVAASNYVSCGIYITDGTKLFNFYVQRAANDANQLLLQENWTNATTYTSTPTTLTVVTVPDWLRIYSDGTNLNCQISDNGADWLTMISVPISGGFLGTPTAAGFLLATSPGAIGAYGSLLNWELTAGAGSTTTFAATY